MRRIAALLLFACLSFGSVRAQNTTNPVSLELSIGDPSGSESERYHMKVLRYLQGDTIITHIAKQFGVVETRSFSQFRLGTRYTVHLKHLGTDRKYKGPPRPDYDYFAWVDPVSGEPAVVFKDDDGILGDHYESNQFFAEGKSFNIIIPKVEMVTPKGDPGSAPDDAGDGQNEFTFDAASPGVLTIPVKFKINPDSQELRDALQDNVWVSIDAIGTSHDATGPYITSLAWDNPGNPATDGKATYSGGFWTATATFIGLPQTNGDFGRKNVTVTVYANGGTTRFQTPIEVFFDKNATNHYPHSGYTAQPPNWFYYWQEGGVCGIQATDLYDPAASYGYTRPGVDTIMRLGPAAATTNNGPETFTGSTPYGALTVTGQGEGIQCVAETIEHERHHLTLYTALAGQADGDGDGIANADEPTIDGVASDPSTADTYNMSAVYPTYSTYGDNEIRCRLRELSLTITVHPDQDWANPGSQTKTKFGP